MHACIHVMAHNHTQSQQNAACTRAYKHTCRKESVQVLLRDIDSKRWRLMGLDVMKEIVESCGYRLLPAIQVGDFMKQFLQKQLQFV